MSKEYPKCRICGQELAEGYTLSRDHAPTCMHVCYDCFDLISAVAHDGSVSVIQDLAEIMSGMAKPDVTWKYKLEPIDQEEVEAK